MSSAIFKSVILAAILFACHCQEVDVGLDRRVFYNGSGLVFFKAQEPLKLLVNNVTFDLENTTVEARGTTSNDTSVLDLSFKSVTSNSDKLDTGKISFSFTRSAGYWRLVSTTLSVTGELQKKIISLVDVPIVGPKIEAPKKYSYHCSRVLKYKNDSSLAMFVKGIQVQPFDINMDRFDDGYDCEGFFTVAIWAGIFLTILMGILLGWGISMLMSINTPDKFDDPKGKPLVINAQE